MTPDNSFIRSTQKPKVSVIIPVYNVEKYLRECLGSVVSQTLPDIEIICVNDCSPDNSQEILDEYGAQYNNFVLLKHEKNKGLAGARNTGLAKARGDYIYFLDSDDFLAGNDALQSLYDAAIADDSDETIGGVLKWDESTGEKYLDWHANYLKEEVHGEYLVNLPQLWANVVACNKLLLHSFLKKHAIRFNENIRKHEDNPFSVKVHLLANKISILTKTIYIYRQVPAGSIMSTVKKTDAFQRCLYCQEIFSFIEVDSTRHKFREMYYPMYSRQLIGSAEILSHFSPSDEEKMELLKRWVQIVNLLPDEFPEIPARQREIFRCVKNGDMIEAWMQSIEFVLSSKGLHQKLVKIKKLRQEVERLENLNKKLTSQIEHVQNTFSWRITASLRNCFNLFIGS